MFSLRATIPAYTAILEDGSKVEMEDKNHVLSVNVVGGYLVKHLMDDLASRTIWGSCQEPICWFWDRENKYLQQIITNTDLDNAFQMYWTSKVLTLVVQFELKPGLCEEHIGIVRRRISLFKRDQEYVAGTILFVRSTTSSAWVG